MLINVGEFLTIIDINIQKNILQNNLFSLKSNNKSKSLMLQEMLLLWLTQLQEIK
jgi:hypothetical protein